ncbi:F0F1 ATP synthase subunit epsilon [Corynebacterium caspium]|uniref:F0F1 ATP synthase subunit epsilon n=1 Tax=Corynebacterium caspium TaxID=234828 RepID=UPI0003794D59|nr:F0F1 ATP synthase subunit epsilon [Corynebacterium caspium]WKD59445.1 ATP synthase epsilon chain [Corynebacterium caspium DSM 44850]
MADINVQLVAVDRMLWQGTASLVTAQTTEGEIGVLPGHEPLLAQLIDNGVVTIKTSAGERMVSAVQGGFLYVSKTRVTILADWSIWADEVDIAQAEADHNSEDELTRWRADACLKAARRAQLIKG